MINYRINLSPWHLSARKSLFILIIIILFTAVTISGIYGLLNNTLQNNGKWQVSKLSSGVPVMGSREFFQGRQALARCRLNLGAWHGYQEVIYKEGLSPREIEFNFFPARYSYLYLIFNKAGNNFSGIRISDNYLFKNIYFSADGEGKFISKSEFGVGNLKRERWNHARLIFDEDDVSLFINHKLTGVFKAGSLKKQLVGFRCGEAPVLIDDISIKQKDSSRIIRESFHDYKRSPYILIVVFSGLIILNLFIFLFLKAGFRKPLAYLVVIDTLIFGASICCMVFIDHFFTGRYPKYRWSATLALAKKVNSGILAVYGDEPAEPVYRVIYMGSSQAAGSGARTKKQTFVKLAEKKINSEVNGTARVEFINPSVNGSQSSLLLKYYERIWIKLGPKITVVHLCVNDSNPDVFADNLRKIAHLNKQKGIKTIFVLEAESPEIKGANFPLHRVMKGVGREYGILILDLHGYLKNKLDTGIIWWDKYHLAPYGHRLSADFIAVNILNFIKSDPNYPQ